MDFFCDTKSRALKTGLELNHLTPQPVGYALFICCNALRAERMRR